MLHSIEKGDMKAMYIVGEDMALVDSNANRVHDILSGLDFLIVQDIFLSRTAQYADVVLPAAPSLEKEGTFTNTERRVQRLYQALPALGDSKPDWRIIQEIANRLGAGWNYNHPGTSSQKWRACLPYSKKQAMRCLKAGTAFYGAA